MPRGPPDDDQPVPLPSVSDPVLKRPKIEPPEDSPQPENSCPTPKPPAFAPPTALMVQHLIGSCRDSWRELFVLSEQLLEEQADEFWAAGAEE